MTIRGSNGYFGRAKFKTHLHSLPPNEIVGERGQVDSCPIALFLAHLIPEARPYSISVSDTEISYRITYQDHVHQTPLWAFGFIATIDGPGHRDVEVTAREALAALE